MEGRRRARDVLRRNRSTVNHCGNSRIARDSANQVTKISAHADTVAELPLALEPTGDWNAVDESLWSTTVFDSHIDGSDLGSLPHDLYRVLYVNDERWLGWRTPKGEVMLPEDDLSIRIMTQWGTASLFESSEMNSGVTNSVLGLVTPTVVATVYTPDASDGLDGDGEGDARVVLQGWDGSTAGAAAILAGWIAGAPVPFYFDEDSGTAADPEFFVQLFFDAALARGHDIGRSGEDLVQAVGDDMDFLGRGFQAGYHSEFGLHLGASQHVIDTALDVLGAGNDEYRDMIAAARDPRSPQAIARDGRWADIRDQMYGSPGTEDSTW